MGKNYISKIFVLDDDDIYGKLIQFSLDVNDNYDVSLFNDENDFLNCLHENPDIVIIDHNLTTMTGLEVLKHVKKFNHHIGTIILSGQDKVDVVVDSYNAGANYYIIKNDNAVPEVQNAVKNLSSNTNLLKQVEELKEQIIDRNKYDQIIGESEAIIKVIRLIQKVEKSNILTLITGESGTGKELAARAIHYNSHRKKGSFVIVNMAAIPEDLIESELFGHEKGAFTGAVNKRIGKFEEADGGSIFLDEIGEMDNNLQAKLLRVLQDNVISRLGSNKEIKLDVRVIAATNKNLSEQVKKGVFREDLFYRLQGFLINMPPLQERGNDIIIIAKSFLEDTCKKNKMPTKQLSREAMEALLSHSWPGNVRELKSVIERAALLSETEIIQLDDLIFSDQTY